jgi:hypothetical protein
MKDNKKNSASNVTMLILGAGASIGAAKFPIESSMREALAKMPSGENFFYDLFYQKKEASHSKSLLNVLGLTYEGLNKLIVRAWGLQNNLDHFDPEEWKQINIEEVFTFLDIGSYMYPRNSQYQKSFKICRSSLTSFITTLLSIKSEGFHCETLMDLLFKLKPTDSIISFNWDTIVDFTLQRSGLPIYEGYLNLMLKKSIRVRGRQWGQVFHYYFFKIDKNMIARPDPNFPEIGFGRNGMRCKQCLLFWLSVIFIFSNSVLAEEHQAIDFSAASAYFKELRESYAKNQEGIISWTNDTEREELLKIYKSDPEKFLQASKTWLEQCPVDAQVHMMRASVLSKMGKFKDSIRHRNFFYGLMASIVNSGDGKTKETAFKVIAIEEEYTLLNFMGAEMKSQSLQGNYDVMEVKLDEGDTTIYFDISTHLEALEKGLAGIEKK